MSLMLFKCEICLKIFKDEFDLNTHMLFIEGLFRPFCSTDKTDYSFKFNPKTNEYRKEYRNEYNIRPEVKAKRKEIRDIPENKEKAKEYQSRPENKAKRKAFEQTFKRKEYRRIYYLRKKGMTKT